MSHTRSRLTFCLLAGWCACTVLVVARTVDAQTPQATSGAQAPQVPAGPLTLAQVLELAEARSESLAIARTAVGRAEADQVRARSGLLPQLSGSASYDRALASEFEGVFDAAPSTPACPDFAPNQQASIDARVSELERALDCGAAGADVLNGGSGSSSPFGDLENLPFGRKNTWRASLAFSQNLYSGGRNGAQAAVASAGRETAEIGVVTTRGQLRLDVTQAYFDVVLSERLVAIADATLQQASATLNQTQAGFDAGTQPEFEVLRARVSRDSQTPILIRQRANREVAILRLKQLLDLPATYDLRLADSLSDDRLPPPPVFAERVAAVESAIRPGPAESVVLQANLALPQRAAVDEAGGAVSISEAALRLVRAQRMPSVTLNSNYSRIAYPTGVIPDFDRSNWTVGASVQVPILTGGRQHGDELAARADLDQNRLRLQQARELADLDTRSSWAELVAARAAWEATAGTVQQATRAYEIADVRYRAGVSTQLELSDSRLLLQQAEVSRTQAARDLQIARARVALLPELPIAAPGGGAGRITPTPSPQLPAQQPQGQIRNAATQTSAQTGAR